MCSLHWQRTKADIPLDLPEKPYKTRRRPKAGDTQITELGYRLVYCPEQLSANGGHWLYEHRVVVEQMIGRPLVAGENVHHKNGDRLDNRPENLELWSTSQPPGQRIEDKVAFAREILALYDATPEEDAHYW